jgi:hypothetical protein
MLQAQAPTNFTKEHFLFIDHKKQIPVLVFEDSTMYQGYDFKKSKLTGLFGETPLKDLRAIKLKGQTYIVDRGCGPVFKFEENTFNRIDKSFRQRNQYGALVFAYNNQIHFYGGYGLFTLKNIVTYYDESVGEWFELTLNSKIKPEPTERNIGLLKDKELYAWQGEIKKDSMFQEAQSPATVWKLNVHDKKWVKQGETQKIIESRNSYFNTFQVKDILYLVTSNSIYKVDIFNNKVLRYDFKMPNIKDCVYDPYTNQLIVMNKNISSNAKNLFFYSLDELTKDIASANLFYKPETSKSYTFYFFGAGLVLGLLIIYNLFFSKIRRNKKIVYNEKKNTLVYNKNQIYIDKGSHDLFVFLVKNQNDFVLLDSVNDLFVNQNTQESPITINKRRDIAVKKLIFTLSTFLNKKENEILLERKNIQDKRIKEIKLNIFVDIIE